MINYDTDVQRDDSMQPTECSMQMRATDWSDVIADASYRLPQAAMRERISNVTRELMISFFYLTTSIRSSFAAGHSVEKPMQPP